MIDTSGTLNQHDYPSLPESEYAARHTLLREKMGGWGVDCLIVYGGYREMYQQNALWITGCREMFQYYVVFPRAGEPTVFGAVGPHLLNTQRMTSIADVRGGGSAPAGPVMDRIEELGLGKSSIGIVGVHSGRTVDLPHGHFEHFRQGMPEAEFKFLTREFENELLWVKSPTELKFYERGAACTDASMAALIAGVRPGVTEVELYGDLMAGGYKAGGMVEFALLGSTPMSDPEMPYPWHVPSHRKVGPGDIIQNEISVAYAGCSGQLIVPIALGEPTAEYRELYELAREVHDRIARVLKPGNTEQEILEAASPIKDAGMTSMPLVHGWPNPPIRPFATIPQREGAESFKLVENQLIMLEPNPTYSDHKHGLFLGALHVVTPEGGKNLHEHPLDFVVK